MATSNYTTSILSYDSPVGSIWYYPLLETSGANFNPLGGVITTPLVINGAVSLDQPSLLPGENAANPSASQNKGTYMASRDDNALLDRPSNNPNKLTIAFWYKPTQLKSTRQVLTGKGFVFSISQNKNRLECTAGSQFVGVTGNPLQTNNDIICQDGTYFVVMTYDGSSSTKFWRIYINGILSNQSTPTGDTTLPHSGGGRFTIGGNNANTTEGMAGHMQHYAMMYGIALTTAQIQSLYEMGIKSIAEAFGQSAYAYAWSRQIVAANSGRAKIRITNDSDAVVYLSLTSTAFVGGGRRLLPYGDFYETSVWKGPISAIHANGVTGGLKNLAIIEE